MRSAVKAVLVVQAEPVAARHWVGIAGSGEVSVVMVVPVVAVVMAGECWWGRV